MVAGFKSLKKIVMVLLGMCSVAPLFATRGNQGLDLTPLGGLHDPQDQRSGPALYPLYPIHDRQDDLTRYLNPQAGRKLSPARNVRPMMPSSSRKLVSQRPPVIRKKTLSELVVDAKEETAEAQEAAARALKEANQAAAAVDALAYATLSVSDSSDSGQSKHRRKSSSIFNVMPAYLSPTAETTDTGSGSDSSHEFYPASSSDEYDDFAPGLSSQPIGDHADMLIQIMNTMKRGLANQSPDHVLGGIETLMNRGDFFSLTKSNQQKMRTLRGLLSDWERTFPLEKERITVIKKNIDKYAPRIDEYASKSKTKSVSWWNRVRGK